MKTILITGATSGFGQACARLMAEQGWRVIITGRRQERLSALCQELEKAHGPCAHMLCFDVRRQTQVAHAIATLPKEWTEIDVLVNNAGLAAGLDPLQQAALDDWERMIDTNVKGLLYVTRTVVPHMIRRGRGHVVNIGSTAGKEVYPGGNVYCATKHAVDALTKALRLDLLPHGIRVSQIAPGMSRTEFSLVRFGGDTSRAESVYQGMQPLLPEDIAELVRYVVSLPPHVCVNDMVVTPTAQANSTHVVRQH
jgi:3-hydroxy acid dehydrogenase / malonic semialdehyde reductase